MHIIQLFYVSCDQQQRAKLRQCIDCLITSSCRFCKSKAKQHMIHVRTQWTHPRATCRAYKTTTLIYLTHESYIHRLIQHNLLSERS